MQGFFVSIFIVTFVYAGPFFSGFTIWCDLINLLELHKIVFILWFTRPHIKKKFHYKLLKSATRNEGESPRSKNCTSRACALGFRAFAAREIRIARSTILQKNNNCSLSIRRAFHVSKEGGGGGEGGGKENNIDQIEKCKEAVGLSW